MKCIIRTILQLLYLLSISTLVTPGPHTHRRNTTEFFLNKYCSLVDHSISTQCVQSEYHLLCRGGITRQWMKQPKLNITHLRVLECPGPCVNAGRIQQLFPRLTTLEFINCTKLHMFKGQFGSASKIEKLVIRGSPMLWEIPPEVVRAMPDLKILDLRGNGIRHMQDEMLSAPASLQQVYLSDNQWDCSDGGLDWLAMKSDNSTARKRIVDYNKLMCHQQLYKGKPLHIVMVLLRTMHQTCPPQCLCTMTYVVTDANGAVIPMITVNCAGKKLEAPPASLPPGTTTLRLEGNKINSIRSIVQNPQYRKLADLFLENNSISTVKEFEGSEWFTTFRILSLRGNKLKQIPVYAFDKAFQVNNDIGQVYLGNNPWRCDCHFIPRFQGLLLKYKKVIKDLKDIKCSKSNDKMTSSMQISTMPLGNVCGKNEMEMPISTINIANLVLLTLIVIILSKFLYDWRKFKATGQLPWLSSILP